jgi:uncharacterized membrane protein YqiK
MELLTLIIVIIIILFTTFIAILTRYKKCPSDRILVVYGKVGKTQAETSLVQNAYTVVRHSYGRYSNTMSS